MINRDPGKNKGKNKIFTGLIAWKKGKKVGCA